MSDAGTHDPHRLAFFLGGRDLEMAAIADLVRDAVGAHALHDKALAWGAAASAYRDEIAAAVAHGRVPVLVELGLDIALPPAAVVVDHHGADAAKPCSLRQVFALLGRPEAAWTRSMQLVAANDVGHIAGLRRAGATAAEIAAVRAADRAAQGITEAEETAGRAALDAARPAAHGRVLVVRLPHERTATVTDPLALMEGDHPDLLVAGPRALHFFGAGALVAALDTAFPGGWSGGELPDRGFWGIGRSAKVDEAAVLACLGRGLDGRDGGVPAG